MRGVFFSILLLCASGCGRPPDTGLHDLFGRYYEDYLREKPEEATTLGRTDHDHRWRDWSRAARAAWAEKVDGYLRELEAYEPSELGEQDGLSWHILRRELEMERGGLPYEAYLVRLNQLFGLHTAVLLTLREMPSQSEKDYENMLARLRAVPEYVDQNIETLREGLKEGIAQPRLVVDLVARQLQAQSSPAAGDSPLLAAFRDIPARIPPARASELAARAEQAYEEAFRPAWRRLRSFLVDEYAERARESLAVTSLPEGEVIYRFFIGYHTTLPLSAAEIHEIGRREVGRIDRAMEKIVAEAGFDGTVAEYERHLLTDARYLFEDRESMLAYHRDIAMRVSPQLPGLFRKLPRHPFGIRAIPPDREAASASNYNAPAADGTRPGWFNLKAYRADRQSRFDKPALVLHETNPGHHLQIASQLELDGLPEFRRIFHSTSYVEGWALYAETLGTELGVYDDPPSRFGALESERFRARRLVVDTGLHSMGWTRRQAIDYLGDESEVDRYIAWPGQALAYKMGQLAILDLKATACQAYGVSFDVRDFHEAVLGNGPLPLNLLEDQVGAYIERADPADAGPCGDDSVAPVN